MRKIIQITGREDSMIALCDDGTLWELHKGAWRQLPGVPQEIVPQNGWPRK